MVSFWKHVNKVIAEADIIIEVLDGRLIEETRNKELEDKVAKAHKKLLYVMTKADLCSKEAMEIAKKKLQPSVFISSTQKQGTTILKKKILEISRGEKVTVGIVGYPNVGKSSLINALSGKGAARTSSQSGFTKGVQKVRVDGKILVLDTPGVLPYKETDARKHAMTGSIDYSQLKDPEDAALHFITEHSEKVRLFYDLSADNPQDLLEELAVKLNRLHKGGVPDTESAARTLLKDWQTGRLQI